MFICAVTLYRTLSVVDYAAAVKPLPIIKAQHGLHLRALVDIEEDETGAKRREGDEWQLQGPITYLPRPDVVSIWCNWSNFIICYWPKP